MGFVIVILALLAIFIVNVIIASYMENTAEKKGYGKEAHAFAMCFWLGIAGYLYVVALPDLKQREQLDKIIKLLDPQVPSNPPQQDVAWKLTELTPESPKRDGSAEVYLQRIGKTPEGYACTTLVATTINAGDQCSVCKQNKKATKLCRLIQKDKVSDIPICSDCINVFIEYNQRSVYDLERK